MCNKNLIIVAGAQKAGTTTIWSSLIKHESIYPLRMSSGKTGPHGKKTKEPGFFALEKNVVKEKIKWYKSLFGEKDGWYVDASNAYLLSPNFPNILAEVPFTVKIIVVLRDPVDRLLSAWLHASGGPGGTSYERRSFEEIVNHIWSNREQGIAEAEDDSINKAILNEKVDKDHFVSQYSKYRINISTADIQDPLWMYKYFQNSMYSNRISELNSYIGDTHILTLEDIKHSFSKSIHKIFRHVGVEQVEVENIHNNKSEFTSYWWKKIAKYVRKMSYLENLLDSRAVGRIKNAIRPKKTRKEISKSFKEYISKSKKLLQPEYEHWKCKRPNIYAQWS